MQAITGRFVHQWISSKTGDTQNQLLKLEGAYDKNLPLVDDHVSSDYHVTKQSGWILSIQRMDGNKVSVYVPERTVRHACEILFPQATTSLSNHVFATA